MISRHLLPRAKSLPSCAKPLKILCCKVRFPEAAAAILSALAFCWTFWKPIFASSNKPDNLVSWLCSDIVDSVSSKQVDDANDLPSIYWTARPTCICYLGGATNYVPIIVLQIEVHVLHQMKGQQSLKQCDRIPSSQISFVNQTCPALATC